MSDAEFAFMIAAAAGLALAVWKWARVDVGEFAVTRDCAQPDPPGWTEEEARGDGLGYGRKSWQHNRLRELDARARRGELDGPA